MMIAYEWRDTLRLKDTLRCAGCRHWMQVWLPSDFPIPTFFGGTITVETSIETSITHRIISLFSAPISSAKRETQSAHVDATLASGENFIFFISYWNIQRERNRNMNCEKKEFKNNDFAAAVNSIIRRWDARMPQSGAVFEGSKVVSVLLHN